MTQPIDDLGLIIGSGGASSQTGTGESSSGELDLNVGVISSWSVVLDEDINTFTISNVNDDSATVLVKFQQDLVGGHIVTFPANYYLEQVAGYIVNGLPGAVTDLLFTTVDGGTTWYVNKTALYFTEPSFVLPIIASENAVFNEEGDSDTGWTPTNCTLSVVSDSLRMTKTNAAGAGCNATKPMVIDTDRDFIFYMRARASEVSGQAGVIWITRPEPSPSTGQIAVWFGSPDGGSTFVDNTMSLSVRQDISTINAVQIGSGINFETDFQDIALQFDTDFSTVTAWYRENDGSWSFAGRVFCDYIETASVQMITTTGYDVGDWIEFDFLTVAYPNIVSVGDSVCEGALLYSPDLSDALEGDESTWQKHALLYPALRNNLIVNKGIGGETSAGMEARSGSIVATGASVVFLHASSNDYTSNIGYVARTESLQDTIDACTSASMDVVLLNALYGTVTRTPNLLNPAGREYMETWWKERAPYLTGVSSFIDIMKPLSDVYGFQDVDLTQAPPDNLHPNVAGYTAIGEYISS